MLGWNDFDPVVVAGIKQGDPRFVDKSVSGGMSCPISEHSHEDLLAWAEGDYTKGTVVDAMHPYSFRVSPTFIYADPLDNFIAGEDLIAQAISGSWDKAETSRLGYEKSEDAVSWNFFRSVQEAGLLRTIADELTGTQLESEPNLIFWGRRISMEGSEPCVEIKEALNFLEPNHSQRTEPDVVLECPGWGWVFIEAKFMSPNPTYKGKPEKLKRWISTYSDALPDLFDQEALEAGDPLTFPEQLLRNVAVASVVCEKSSKAVVVSLTPHSKKTEIESEIARYLPEGSAVQFRCSTWEELMATLPPGDSTLALRSYMENKSAGLRKAFRI